MKVQFILVLLLIVPISYALDVVNYTNYDYMTLLYSANSEIKVFSVGNDPKLMSLDIKLNLFPKESYRQSVLRQSVITKPEIYVDYNPDFDKEIELSWKNLNTNLISFQLDSKVLTKNIFYKIGRIRFPIDVNDKKLEEFIEETEYIDINNDIRNKANEIVEGEDDFYKAVYKLAEWIRTNVDYDLSVKTEEVVQKSSWVLKTRKGVCDEITNLFISFLRSLGIPAKFITGVAYSNIIDNFGNHGWAEVYFPGYGWVPFDVTYGEYGWLDATHIKLNENKDSSVFSVNYNWKSRDLEVQTRDLETKVVLLDKGKQIKPLTRLEVNLLENDVGLGSFVPVQVIIENLQDYYIADKIHFTKAPKLIDENTRVVLLGPREIKEEYWIIRVPSEVERGYKYSTLVKVNSAFGVSGENLLRFSEEGDIIDKIKANKIVEELRKRESKKYFLDLDFNCDLLKKKYYSNENVNIKCSVKNIGNVLLEDLQVCLKRDCRKFDLGINEQKEIEFETYVSDKITVVAENEDMIKYVNLELDIVEVPSLKIYDLNPENIDYKDKKEFSFVLESDYDAYDVEIKIENKKRYFDVLSGKQKIFVELSGYRLINGFDIKILYKDEEGKLYVKKEKIFVTVNNVPWYARMFGWILNIF